MEEEIKCPQCGAGMEYIRYDGRNFSVGKAIGGAILVGPIGLLGGALGGKKVKLSCIKCGHKWKRWTK